MKKRSRLSTAEFARELRRAREAKGLTQANLGQRMGVPQSHISTIEHGRTDLRLSSLLEMARQLDHDVMLIPRKYVPAVRSIRMGRLAEQSGSATADQTPAYGVDADQNADETAKNSDDDNDPGRFRP